MISKPSTPPEERVSGILVGSEFLSKNFEPYDRLAVVLVNKRDQVVIQRISDAKRIAAPDYQAWLKEKNGQGYEVYVSMNALSVSAEGRSKSDVEVVRHVYLDFDHEGTAAVERLTTRDDIPRPNFVVSTSPDKWQIVWKVEGFAKDDAERLQQYLARDTGADIAATDCSRVLRLPGFLNHKYKEPHLVTYEERSGETYRASQFPIVPKDIRRYQSQALLRPAGRVGPLSQSERDWAFAKRSLSRGEPAELVIAQIASYRRFEKYDPQGYAERTVRKAAEAIKTEPARSSEHDR